MLTLETVAHAWNYERALAYHLSAFILHPPTTCRLRATIFYATEDEPVARTLEFFAGLDRPAGIEWNFRALSPGRLCRRAIGRNMAALDSTADFVLFSDVDYLFGAGALDAAASGMATSCRDAPKLMFPRYLQSSIDHAAGDAELARADRPQVIAVEPERYQTTRLGKAIGGAQWLPGDFCRERGYVRESRRFQRPAATWKRTYEDRLLRISSGLPSCELLVPNIFRLRHSARGRFDVGCRN